MPVFALHNTQCRQNKNSFPGNKAHQRIYWKCYDFVLATNILAFFEYIFDNIITIFL